MRDDFSQKVLDTLAKRVGVRCSNPGCRKLTTGPRSDASRIVCIGVGAHITAASPGGRRYDPSLTPEQRAAEDNGIWLCQNCGKLIDNDEERYTIAVLRGWKQRAEAAALAEVEGGITRGPEDAAELELAVGGAVIGGPRLPRTFDKRFDASGHCDRHDYELTVTVRNLGNERLSGYHVDLEFPVRVLEHPEKHPAYIRERSNRDWAFFRASGAAAPELFPGDAPTVLTVRYYMDDKLHWNRHEAPESHVHRRQVRATLYRPGLPPLVLERPFKEFENF